MTQTIMQNRCVAFGKHHFDVIMSIQNRSDDVTNDKTNALTMHSVRHYCRGDQSAYFLVVEDSYDHIGIATVERPSIGRPGT